MSSARGETPDATTILRRWEDSGAVWRVISRRPSQVTVALYECTGGQEVDRLASDDPTLLDFIGDRASSED
ncbi:hypothetical protein [Nocardia iowensis]|uniref:Uncharacterized protein n=1 Tax=Nocardia iowensis TaxID=204891 RepID=A0ABX8REM1_NOCIO|nr:hypothetical protein [Nocardia iowensis]QXN88048.1 hypothetical protein KV110_20685 [Nocardia iowensis]